MAAWAGECLHFGSVSLALHLTAIVGACAQRFRHNTLCRHELGRRLAGFACVQLLPSRKMVWVPNREHSLLPFDENLERLGTPTLVREHCTLRGVLQQYEISC
jgi:hypothetical protein|eukprot:COSAG02_NODE_1275_length_13506_cov_8.845603_8_plen_103_part_00